MRSKLPILGVIIVLGAGYMAAQPFRQTPNQPTASAPTTPRTPLRWNEPVPLQVTSSQEFSPSQVPPMTADEAESRPSFARIPRIQASGEFAALSDPPPQIAQQYEAPKGRDPFEAPLARPSHETVAATVSRDEAAHVVPAVSPVEWPETPRQQPREERLASLPARLPAVASTSSPRVHRVVDGDSLPRLAEQYLGNASRYLEIYEANRDLLASPDLLPLGVKLVIPVANGRGLPQQTSAHAPAHPPPATPGLVPIGGI